MYSAFLLLGQQAGEAVAVTAPPWPVLADMVGHLVWPGFLVVVVLVVRREVRRIFAALAERFEDPQQRITAGRDGFSVGPAEVTESAASEETINDPPATPRTPGERLRDAHMNDDAFPDKLEEWLAVRKLNVSATSFLYGSGYEGFHQLAAADLLG